MSQSTRVFTDTFDSSPTSLLRLPFAPDPTLPAKSEQPSSFSTGIVLAVVGGATLLLSGVIALGVLVYLRRRARLRSEAIMREERAIWREGTWTSLSDLQGRKEDRGRPELAEKRTSSSSSFSASRVYIHPSTASWSPPASPPLIDPAFPRSRPMQDIPSDAASFNTFSASVIHLSGPAAPALQADSSGDNLSGHSLPFFVPPATARVARMGLGAKGSGRWD